MLKVHADLDRCEGYANCVVAADDVFDIDDDGIVKVLQSSVDETRLDEVTEAVHSCPVAALSLEEK